MLDEAGMASPDVDEAARFANKDCFNLLTEKHSPVEWELVSWMQQTLPVDAEWWEARVKDPGTLFVWVQVTEEIPDVDDLLAFYAPIAPIVLCPIF